MKDNVAGVNYTIPNTVSVAKMTAQSGDWASAEVREKPDLHV